MSVPPQLRPHASWARFLASWSRSRRLTEPPRPANVGDHIVTKEAPEGVARRSESRLASTEAKSPPRPQTRFPQKAPTAEGAVMHVHAHVCGYTPRGDSGLRAGEGGFPIAPSTPSVPPLIDWCLSQRRKVAAALSAAVTTTRPIGDTPNSQAEPTPQKHTRQTPAALRKRGGWGRGASLREAASPPETPRPPRPSSEGAWGRGFSIEKPLPRNTSPVLLRDLLP